MRNSALVLVSVLLLSGCVVRTYRVTKDRVDQDLSGGNRGYLQGSAPQAPERKPTRSTQIVEVELRPPLKFEKVKAPGESAESSPSLMEEPVFGNQGYMTEGRPMEITGPAAVEKYTVQKGDTLQKISQKFYGTTKRWNKIFEANKDVLKAPNKIYPGQVINVPVEGMKEPVENLK